VVHVANYALVVGITAGGVAQLAVEPEKAITLKKEYGK
jgi:flagellar biogenesis protein FliO